MKNYFRLAISILLSLALVACASTTSIRVSDPRANIYVDDEYIGQGSGIHSDYGIVGSSSTVTVKRDGCSNVLTQNISKTGSFNVAPFIVGLFLLWPLWLWVGGYKEQYNFQFNCVEG